MQPDALWNEWNDGMSESQTRSFWIVTFGYFARCVYEIKAADGPATPCSHSNDGNLLLGLSKPWGNAQHSHLYSEQVQITDSVIPSLDTFNRPSLFMIIRVGLFVFFADMMVIMLIKMLLSAFSVYPVMSGEATVGRFRGAQLEVKKKCKCIWNKGKASNPINCNWERWLALIKISITWTMVINYIKTFTNREAGRHFFLTRKHPQVQKCNYYF